MSPEAKTPILTPFMSQKFRFWAFVSMILLVFVHGYNLNARYLQPWTITEEPLTATGFMEYFTANGIFRFRIPMLFAISGFLFALADHQSYGARAKKRLRTLGLPYLLWGAISFALFFVMELFPYTRNIVAESHMMQVDEQRVLLQQNHWWEIGLRWILAPPAYQLWFIRVLLIYNLAYPLIRWCVMHRIGQKIFFPIVTLLWLMTFGLPIIEGEGLLFFSLGVWIAKKGFDIEKPARWMKLKLLAFLFVAFAAAKTWLAFKGFALMGEPVFYIMLLMHKITIASGLITAWYAGDALVKWGMNKQWVAWATAFSFIIYALHAPVVALAINVLLPLGEGLPYYRLLLYIALPLALIALSIGLGATLRSLAPGAYALLTGDRGLKKTPAFVAPQPERAKVILENHGEMQRADKA